MNNPVEKRRSGARFGTRALNLVLGFILTLLGLVLLEGISSAVLFVRDIARASRGPMAERTHTRYDELLGWVNVENVEIEDLYGEGLSLRTNSQGFRANQDYDGTPPAGKLRIICSGDSFTLGYGVGNDDTWCQLLATLDDRLQTVNMGQGGYGIDQAYLWYERDGAHLQHGVHLFTFITADFWRMRQRSFHGYGKPFLVLRDGELVVENVPVPRAAFYAPWVAQNIRSFERLRTVQLLREVLPTLAERDLPSPRHQRRVLLKVIERLSELNRSRGSLVVVVLLPTEADAAPDPSHPLRRFLRRELEDREIVFFDLIGEIQRLPPRKLNQLFIQRGPDVHEFAGGHYSVNGNEYIAGQIYEALVAIPEFSSRLSELSPAGEAVP